MLNARDKKSKFRRGLKKAYNLVNELDINYMKSHQLDNQMIMMMTIDRCKTENVCSELQEAQKENKQLINMLQLDDRLVPRTNSSTSCSTMSLVHLQYKYEELVANQNGLLKILDMRHEESKKLRNENVKLKEEIEKLKYVVNKYEIEFSKLLDQVKKIKKQKNRKIKKLKIERNTLRMVHNKFVSILNEQALEQDQILLQQLRFTENSEKALLIQEIRKSNSLLYENFQLHQKVDYLQALLKAKSSRPKLSSTTSKTSSNL